jgi:hypothetical protein
MVGILLHPLLGPPMMGINYKAPPKVPLTLTCKLQVIQTSVNSLGADRRHEGRIMRLPIGHGTDQGTALVIAIVATSLLGELWTRFLRGLHQCCCFSVADDTTNQASVLQWLAGGIYRHYMPTQATVTLSFRFERYVLWPTPAHGKYIG